jgi:hypothetical protein
MGKSRIISLLAVLCMAFVLGFPSGQVQAQGEPVGFRNVRLWVYPEYDDPRLLVMLEGQVEGVEVPATVRFLVPSGAEMYSAGSMDAQGSYSGGPPQRGPSAVEGWDEISYQVTTDTFRVEYYDPIIRGQPDKTIAYEFRTLYPISDLLVIVQEPLRSSNFSITPRADSIRSDEQFTFHLYSFTGLGVGQVLEFHVQYTKADPDPSLVIAQESSTSLPLVAGTFTGVVILLAAGAFWILRARPRRRPVSALASSPPRKGGGEAAQGRFCTQCGHRLRGSPRFCPNCGARLQ